MNLMRKPGSFFPGAVDQQHVGVLSSKNVSQSSFSHVFVTDQRRT
jgi:hypothetical protein